MYKKITLLSSVLLCSLTQHASDLTPWLELKPSYFFFATSPMHAIYHKGGFELQGSGSVPVYKYLAVYGSLGVRKAWGSALNTGETTTFTAVPIDIGLKAIFEFWDCYYYFVAFGPRFFYFHQHNNSPYIDPTINGGGVGFFMNMGFNMHIKEHFLLGVFGEYSYEKKTIRPTMLNVYSNGGTQIGGFAFGASVGYAF